jgi:hypothetical protein
MPAGPTRRKKIGWRDGVRAIWCILRCPTGRKAVQQPRGAEDRFVELTSGGAERP